MGYIVNKFERDWAMSQESKFEQVQGVEVREVVPSNLLHGDAHVDRQTDTTENITFPQVTYAGGNATGTSVSVRYLA